MRIGDLANTLTKPKRQPDGSFLALCPAHADKKTLSLHVSEQEGKILLKCFAGCTTEAICQALNIEVSDLFAETGKVPERKIIATYSYQDESGQELYQVVRFDPKGFSQRHKNDDGEYIWKMDGVRRVLYHLPDVLAATGTVYVVEGEKDADNLRKHGLTATTSPGGAGAWKPEYANYLAGKNVVLIPDKDKAGYAYAHAVRDSLATAPKCIVLPDGYKDISDWLLAGKVFEDLHTEDIAVLTEPLLVFENKGSRYLFTWGTFQAEVSKVKAVRDTTICQLVIYPASGTTFRTKFNLESDRTRTQTAKELTLRYKDEDWKNLIEEITNKTLEEFEKGAPVRELTSADETPELEYLIYPLFPLGKPTVLFGDPGAGKSQMAVITNIVTAFNDWRNPLRLTGPKRIMRGLVLDWEADADDWQRQLKWYTSAFELGWANLYHRRCSLSLSQELEAIRQHIEDTHADYVIIDSVSLAAGGDLNHMDVATSYFRAIRQLTKPDGTPVTTISLAHTSKDRESKQKTILGSVLFEAGARNVWEVRGEEDIENKTLDIGLFHRKSNLAQKHTPLGYRIQYDVDPANIKQTIPISMSWLDPTSVEEFVERMKTTDRILHYLTGNQADEEKIAKDLGLTLNNARVALSRLKVKNLVGKFGERWGRISKL